MDTDQILAKPYLYLYLILNTYVDSYIKWIHIRIGYQAKIDTDRIVTDNDIILISNFENRIGKRKNSLSVLSVSANYLYWNIQIRKNSDTNPNLDG